MPPSAPRAPRFLRSLPFLLLAALAGARPAAADETNPYFLPLGEREAMMANAGIASVSAVAAFYNPANLARLEHPSLSLTGTTLLRFDLSTEALLVVNGIDQPFEASGFLTVPASLVSTYQVGDVSLATSVLVPDVFEISNRVTFDFGDSSSTLIQKQANQDLWLGLSGAIAPSDRVSVGLSVFGVQRSTSSLQILSVIAEGDVVAASVTTSSTDTSVLGVTGVLGATLELHPALVAGLRVQSGLLHLRGSADIYQSTFVASEDPTMDTAVEEVAEDLDFRSSSAWDVAAGLALRPAERLQLALDVGVQLPESYEGFSDPAYRVTTELETAVRVSLGGDLEVSDRVRLLAGLTFNGSASPTPDAEGDSHDDYYGATAGIIWQSGRTRTGLGTFYMQTRGDYIPYGAPGRVIETKVRLLGALITAAYSL